MEYRAGSTTIALIESDPEGTRKRVEEGPRGAIGVALAVADVAGAVDELRSSGVPVLGEVMDSPSCRAATVQGPSGSDVWLQKRKDGTTG